MSLLAALSDSITTAANLAAVPPHDTCSVTLIMPIPEHLSQAVCHALYDQPDLVAFQDLQPAEWEQVAAYAVGAGVAPLLHQVFNQAGWPPSAPEKVRKTFLFAYYQAAVNNVLLLDELKTVLQVFSAAGIPVIVLKGPALAMQIYPSLALRPFSDLDLLLPIDSILPAIELLSGRGYQPIVTMTSKFDPLLDIHYVMTGGPSGRVHLELHWNLVSRASDRRTAPIEYFWGQQMAFKLTTGSGSISAQTLSPTVHLLYLASHIVLQHTLASARLIWYYDIHRMISHYQETLDWSLLVAQARQFQWGQVLKTALEVTQDNFGTLLPPEVLPALAAGAEQDLFQDLLKAKGETTLSEIFIRSLRYQSWPGRLRMILMYIFPSPSYMRSHYPFMPRLLWPLTYPYRWGSVLSDFISAMVNKKDISLEQEGK